MSPSAGRPELIIAGAGPVGLLVAWRLLGEVQSGRLGVRIVDAGPSKHWHSEEVDPRVYALSRESQRLLGDLWQEVLKRRASAYRRMRVWEGRSAWGRSSIGFDAADIGEPDLGHIVEDSLLRHVLLDRLARDGIEISFSTAVESLITEDNAVELELNDGTTLRADVVVGADGAGSVIRKAVGIDTVSKDYVQKAIVTHVKSQESHQETAWQRFLTTGPLAFLPLADGRSSIVWSHSSEEADRLLTVSDDDFLAELQSASGDVLGQLGPCSRRLSFPLRLSHAVNYTRNHVVLVGDAAHTVHPLAGQGMNLGLRDAAVLADTLADALDRGEYPGDLRVLKRYERAQKAHNAVMQLAFDAINEAFGPRVPEWASPVRELGLALFDRLEPAKRLLMRQAMGLDRPAGQSR